MYYRTRLIGLLFFMRNRIVVWIVFNLSFVWAFAQKVYPYNNHKVQYEIGILNQIYFQDEFKQEKRRVYSDNYLLSPGLQYHAFKKILINNPKYSHRGMHFLLAGAGLKSTYLPVVKDLYIDRFVDPISQIYKDTNYLYSNHTIRITPSFFLDHTKDIGNAYRIRFGIGIEHHAFDIVQDKTEINKKMTLQQWQIKTFQFSWPSFSSESINLNLRFTLDRALNYDYYNGVSLQMVYGKNRQAVNGINVLKPMKVMLEWHYGIFGR